MCRNMTNYYDSKTWQDNSKENSVLFFVICFLVQKSQKTPEEGIDIDQLNNLAELMKKCLKAKQ